MRAAGVLCVVIATGCLNRRVYDPPARLTVGATTRHHPATPVDDSARFRSTTPPAPQKTLAAQEAKLAGIAFTMAAGGGTYAGGEVETGVLDAPGTSAAAVYGVLGWRRALPGVNFSVELVAGQRWLRYGGEDGEVSGLVAEPRVRTDFWLGSRFSLGATGGLTLGEQTAWMAGVYLGIHSHDFGSRARDQDPFGE